MRRQAMLSKLASMPRASAMMPFVLMSYGQPSTYLWADDAGTVHEIRQGEGGEQGDALMPALYALGQHAALQSAAAQLGPDETLLAYLDDVYVLCRPERACEAFRVVSAALRDHAGVEANKCGTAEGWNRQECS